MEERDQLGGAMANLFMWVTSRLTEGLPMATGLGNSLVWAGFVHAPHCQPHPLALGVGLLDQFFFCARVRVVDLDLATLAFAHGRTRMAPGPVALPTDTRLVQHGPDGVRAHVRQAIRCAPQGTLQRVFNDQTARDLA